MIESIRRLGRIAVGGLLATLLLAGCWGDAGESHIPPTRSARAPAGAPNVLVIVVDTMRADRLGAYGAPSSPTSGLDALAAEGVLFENAFSCAPRTWQSFTTMLTGLQPYRHGVRHLFDEPLAAKISHMGTIFGDNGYTTAAFDVVPFLRWMLDARGFDSFVDTIALESASQLGDAEILKHTLGWIRERPATQPFLAFVRLHGPHWPYHAPRDVHDRTVAALGIDHAAIDHSFNAGNYGTSVTIEDDRVTSVRVDDIEARRRRIFGPPLEPDVHAHMLLHYDLALSRTAKEITRTVDELRAAGILDSTLLIVTADHGESFGGTGYSAYRDHGPRVDDAVMRVPLIVRFPASHPHGRPGLRVHQLVRLADMLPTVLATAGLPVPADLDGTSLLPALDHAVDLGLVAYGESGFEMPEIDPLLFLDGTPGKHRMWRTQRWKLVLIPDGKAGIEILFDMEGEGEARDVGDEHPAVRARLRADLDRVIATDSEATLPATAPTFSPEQEERLRALGYL